MQIDAGQDGIAVQVGATFGARDVSRMQEAIAALGPKSRLTIDFSGVRQCDDGALVLLATMLGCLSQGEVSVKGLSEHHWRLLTYLGLFPDRPGGPRLAS